MAAQAAAQMCTELSAASAPKQGRVNVQQAVCFRSGNPVVRLLYLASCIDVNRCHFCVWYSSDGVFG